MTLPPIRHIAHLDMDAFYASVELLKYPQLRGQPVVVGGRRARAGEESPFARLGDYRGRGVVTTASYEARAFGVHSGMGLMKAAQLAPEAILLPADFDAYRHYSRRFKQAVAQLAPQIEDRGIDEIYIDLSAQATELATLAPRIKQAVREATGLSCSLCVAPNKLLAKIGSDLDKPDGLTWLDENNFRQRIWPLPVRKINGIGPRANEKLARLGITTIAELAAADARLLIHHFGRSSGLWLHDTAHGRDERPVITHSEPKSISRETTFERDLHPRHDRETLAQQFTALCERLEGDLRRKGYCGRTIGIKLRYDNFKTVTRDQTLPEPIYAAAAIRRVAGQCLRRVTLDRKLRLLGVRISALENLAAREREPAHQQQELPLGGG